MPFAKPTHRARNWIVGSTLAVVLLAVAGSVAVNRYIEPALRSRLHTLIIQGSDSLYTYKLGGLDANFFGGSVQVRNLTIAIDTARYRQLEAAHALPTLTLELNLVRGELKGIDIFNMLVNKQVNVQQVISEDANIRLLRHVPPRDAPKNTQPLWKRLQPAIRSITVNHVDLNGVKLLYRNADTADAIKLQFDTCRALFDDIRIDSAAAADTARIAFAKSMDLRFSGLKFRTPDSSYKLKADVVSYSSKTRVFDVTQFKMQPTLKDRASFYKAAARQQTMYVVECDRLKLTNMRLDRFVNQNLIAADTVLLDHPVLTMYNDKTLPPVFESKVGNYPHQQLLRASATIAIKNAVVKNASVVYTEKAAKTTREGTLRLDRLDLAVQNITNDAAAIARNSICQLNATGTLLGGSPLQIGMRFYLAAPDGRFDATGTVQQVTAAQLNALAEPLANVKLQSLSLEQLNFDITGTDLGATANVAMRYNNLFVVLQKQDAETGAVKPKKFITKLLNRFTLNESNPGPDGVVRQAVGVRRSRLSSQSFFGLLWKSLFAGMQDVMLKSGRYE